MAGDSIELYIWKRGIVMNRRFVVGTMVVAAMLAGGTVYAAPAPATTLSSAGYGKTKLVSFNLRNDSKSPIRVKAGEQEMTLEPGKLTPIKLAVGDKIVAEETTPNYPAGTVISVVTSDLFNNTLALN
jgi:hypothetical protein